jgi:hypothetical protein
MMDIHFTIMMLSPTCTHVEDDGVCVGLSLVYGVYIMLINLLL